MLSDELFGRHMLELLGFLFHILQNEVDSVGRMSVVYAGGVDGVKIYLSKDVFLYLDCDVVTELPEISSKALSLSGTFIIGYKLKMTKPCPHVLRYQNFEKKLKEKNV